MCTPIDQHEYRMELDTKPLLEFREEGDVINRYGGGSEMAGDLGEESVIEAFPSSASICPPLAGFEEEYQDSGLYLPPIVIKSPTWEDYFREFQLGDPPLQSTPPPRPRRLLQASPTPDLVSAYSVESKISELSEMITVSLLDAMNARDREGGVVFCRVVEEGPGGSRKLKKARVVSHPAGSGRVRASFRRLWKKLRFW